MGIKEFKNPNIFNYSLYIRFVEKIKLKKKKLKKKK